MAASASGSWHRIAAPRGMTTTALRKRVQEALRPALRDPEIGARLAAAGFAVGATDDAALKALADADLARWREVVRLAGAGVN